MKNEKNNSLKEALSNKLDFNLSNDFDDVFYKKLKTKTKTKRIHFFSAFSQGLSLALCGFALFLMVNQFNPPTQTYDDSYIEAIFALEESLDAIVLTSLNLNEI